jgi:hypothetical protein
MLSSMNGTGDAAITIRAGTARAAIAFASGRVGLMTELSWWAVSLLMLLLVRRVWRSWGSAAFAQPARSEVARFPEMGPAHRIRPL